MASFDLDRFRDLAFGRRALPDHPMQSLAEAKKIVALLPDNDPDRALADLTHWAASMNATDAFTPGRRARVLMELDAASRTPWRAQAARYLAPAGRPKPGREGDAKLLRAMFDCVTEMGNGFAIALDAEAGESGWLEKNRARVCLRNMRALMRRLALAHMLKHTGTTATWERLHRRHALCEELGVARNLLPVFDGDSATSSVRLEYAHGLLLELAAPESLLGREVELVFRIARRVAASVRIEQERFDDAWFAVVPSGDARPMPVARLGRRAAARPLYIGTANCLTRLQAVLERDLGRDEDESDTLYGIEEFTLGECTRILKRLIEHWGPKPPQRRTPRIGMATPVRIISGFERVAGVVPPIEKRTAGSADQARRRLNMQLDATTNALKRSSISAARENPARLVDASAGGMGIAIRRKDAAWASLGMLVAVLIEPGKTWVIGVLRRIYTVDDELRLGVQTLSAKPVAVTLRTDTALRDSVWEEAIRFEATYKELYRTGILLEPQQLPLSGSDVLLPPGLASRGTQFNVPLTQGGEQRIRVARLLDEGEHYQRAMIESLGLA